MKKRKITRKEIRQWLIVLLPVVAICVAGFLPLKPFVSQALIGIVLIWLQATLIFGSLS